MSKKFVGNVKVINTKFGEMVKISISEKDFQENQKNGWVNAVLKKSKEGKYYLELDEWTPEKKESSHTVKAQVTVKGKDVVDTINSNDESLPF
jgi:hypothetical protein